MKNIHRNLCEKHVWYDSWHKKTHHAVVHWILLFLIFGSTIFSITHDIARATLATLPTQANIKAFRATGAIFEDPAVLRLKPVYVVTHDKVKDRKRLESMLDSGQSLIVGAALPTLPSFTYLASWVPPRNQGGEFSCVAFAMSAARSIEEYYKTGALSFSESTNIFSPEYIYNQIKVSDCSSGTSRSSAHELIKSQGVSTWRSMPYSDTNGCSVQPDEQQRVEAANYKMNYSYAYSSDSVTLKNLLANHHPLIFGASLDSDFTNAGTDFIWKSYGGTEGFNHIMVVVGYDDAKHAYRILNSWGDSWGDGGYSWIDYDFFPKVAGMFVSFFNPFTEDIAPPSGNVTTPVEGQVVSGTITLAADASDQQGSVAGVSFRIDGIPVGTEDTVAPYAIAWNSMTVPDALHTISAIIRDTAGNIAVTNEIKFAVSNGATPLDVTTPTVSITSPIYDATLSGKTTLSVSAGDNIGVTRVDFFRGTTLIVSSAIPPFTGVWDTATVANSSTDGSYYIYALAYDAVGNSAKSQTVRVNVTNQVTDTIAPTVSLTAPTTNAVLSGTTTLSATANDNLAVARVDFYRTINGIRTRLASDTTAPYSYLWNTTTVPDGTYNISATAFDSGGYFKFSDPVSITISNTSMVDTIPPEVFVTTPANGSILSNTVVITATASDNKAVDHIDFYQGETLIGAYPVSPYSISWDTRLVANGTYTLSAKAYDAAGNSDSSSPVSVTVSNTVPPTPDTTAPTVSLTNPTSGAILYGTTTLSAIASDNVGVTKVNFYRGTTLIDTDTTTPYSISWDTRLVANGTYTLSAKAYDAAGNSNTTNLIGVTVNNSVTPPPDTTAPTVSIISPLNNTVVPKNTNVLLTASASDNIAVNKVEFRVGSTLTCTDATAPYTCNWFVPKGPGKKYNLTAKAYDMAGNSAITPAITVTSSR